VFVLIKLLIINALNLCFLRVKAALYVASGKQKSRPPQENGFFEHVELQLINTILLGVSFQ